MSKAAFAVCFEKLYHFLRRGQGCRLRREPDTFDGEVLTIDEFCRKYSVFYERPAEFFRDFGYPGAPNLRSVGRVHGTVDIERMVFDSPVQSGWKENDIVPFTLFRRPQRGARTILLFAPGWGRKDQRIEQGVCSRLARSGIDVGLTTKPYHQERAPAGSRSGEYFISFNIFWTIENFRQFTAELRLLIQYMRRFYERVGLIGMSSGGFQAGLAANCEEVDFLFPLITGCQLGKITWKSILTRFIREDLERRGISEADLTRVWSITDQYVLGRHCKARHIKQYISRYDSVVPPEFQWSLLDVYQRPEHLVLDCSHYSVYFELRRIADDIATFVKEWGG